MNYKKKMNYYKQFLFSQKIVYGSKITELNDGVYMATETEPLENFVDNVKKDLMNLINLKL